VAFVSVRPWDGVHQTVARLALEVERTTDLQCAVMASTELIGVSKRGGRSASTAPGLSTDRGRIADVAGEGRVVLIDGGALPDGHILALARQVDGVVIVAESGRTGMKELRQALTAIGAAGGTVLGLVLHLRRKRVPGWRHGWTG
jgi:hypothetical protein